MQSITSADENISNSYTNEKMYSLSEDGKKLNEIYKLEGSGEKNIFFKKRLVNGQDIFINIKADLFTNNERKRKFTNELRLNEFDKQEQENIQEIEMVEGVDQYNYMLIDMNARQYSEVGGENITKVFSLSEVDSMISKFKEFYTEKELKEYFYIKLNLFNTVLNEKTLILPRVILSLEKVCNISQFTQFNRSVLVYENSYSDNEKNLYSVSSMEPQDFVKIDFSINYIIHQSLYCSFTAEMKKKICIIQRYCKRSTEQVIKFRYVILSIIYLTIGLKIEDSDNFFKAMAKITEVEIEGHLVHIVNDIFENYRYRILRLAYKENWKHNLLIANDSSVFCKAYKKSCEVSDVFDSDETFMDQFSIYKLDKIKPSVLINKDFRKNPLVKEVITAKFICDQVVDSLFGDILEMEHYSKYLLDCVNKYLSFLSLPLVNNVDKELLYKLIFNGKLILAGGSVLNSILNYNINSTSDYDLFFIENNKENNKQFILFLFECLKPMFYRIDIASSCVTINSKKPVQFILRYYYDVEHILMSFDTDACCVATDGNKLIYTKQFEITTKYRIIFVDLQRMDKNFEYRICKYMRDKGFSVFIQKLSTFEKQPYNPYGFGKIYKFYVQGEMPPEKIGYSDFRLEEEDRKKSSPSLELYHRENVKLLTERITSFDEDDVVIVPVYFRRKFLTTLKSWIS